MSKHLLEVLVLILLSAITLTLYWQVQDYQFINVDDPLYVTENLHTQKGLTKEGIFWAFSFNNTSYWHPLTWLSHMLDCELYGLNPKGHHFNNLLIHMTSTLVLFLSLRFMTGTLWLSAWVAAIFAVHPLNVESVAWIAERKNVLSTLFWMFAVYSYAYYAKNPSIQRCVIVLIFLALGLLAKPMVVTLPFVFLLLDFWPLRRYPIRARGRDPSNKESGSEGFNKAPLSTLLLEKIPFFALLAVSIVVSVMSSGEMGILIPTEKISLWLRVQNAVISYVVYIEKMFFPSALAFFYPFPKVFPLWKFLCAALVLVSITLAVILQVRHAPYLSVGWFWYLGTLIPVLGLVQQGLWPAFADRFAYVPLIGPFIIVVWGYWDLITRLNLRKTFAFVLPSLVILSLSVGAWFQVQHWKNTITLLERALAVTKDNHLAYYNLGVALHKGGNPVEAVSQLAKAIEILPENAQFHSAMGASLTEQGRLEEAVFHLSKALEIFPNYADAHVQMGNALCKKNLTAEAIIHYRDAIRIKPFAEAHHNLGLTLASIGMLEAAAHHYELALGLKPDYAQVHNDIGVVRFHQGRKQEAVYHFKEALRIKPNYQNPRRNLDLILGKPS